MHALTFANTTSIIFVQNKKNKGVIITMYYDDDGSMFEIHYKDVNGRKHSKTYWADDKKDAQKQFNAERDPGDVMLFVKKVD